MRHIYVCGLLIASLLGVPFKALCQSRTNASNSCADPHAPASYHMVIDFDEREPNLVRKVRLFFPMIYYLRDDLMNLNSNILIAEYVPPANEQRFSDFVSAFEGAVEATKRGRRGFRHFSPFHSLFSQRGFQSIEARVAELTNLGIRSIRVPGTFEEQEFKFSNEHVSQFFLKKANSRLNSELFAQQILNCLKTQVGIHRGLQHLGQTHPCQRCGSPHTPNSIVR